MLVLLVLFVVLLAWGNGANDNFKGVATLFGSGILSYRQALGVATVATLLGSLLSVALAGRLAKVFGGKGLVPDALIDGAFLAAVGGGAMVAILLATLLGMPTSTTHALTGALVGAALFVAGPAGVSWPVLLERFAQPLLLSPVLAVLATAALYLPLRRMRLAAELDEESCLCIGSPAPESVGSPAGGLALRSSGSLAVNHAPRASCADGSQNGFLRILPHEWIDGLHVLSGASVCFARAVNDTPKIAALLLAGSAAGLVSPLLESVPALLLVATAMTLGGYLQSRGVAKTMSLDIVAMNRGQGVTANLVTAGLVLGASRLGVPVSTTHVSCGAIFGLGVATRSGRLATVGRILLVWLTTLPLGALVAALLLALSMGG